MDWKQMNTQRSINADFVIEHFQYGMLKYDER